MDFCTADSDNIGCSCSQVQDSRIEEQDSEYNLQAAHKKVEADNWLHSHRGFDSFDKDCRQADENDRGADKAGLQS